jgi:hypothetical protein
MNQGRYGRMGFDQPRRCPQLIQKERYDLKLCNINQPFVRNL